MDVLSSNSEIVQELEQYVMNWHTHIAVVIEEQQQKYPQVCDCFYVLNSNRCRSDAIAVEVFKLQFSSTKIFSFCFPLGARPFGRNSFLARACINSKCSE